MAVSLLSPQRRPKPISEHLKVDLETDTDRELQLQVVEQPSLDFSRRARSSPAAEPKMMINFNRQISKDSLTSTSTLSGPAGLPRAAPGDVDVSKLFLCLGYAGIVASSLSFATLGPVSRSLDVASQEYSQRASVARSSGTALA